MRIQLTQSLLITAVLCLYGGPQVAASGSTDNPASNHDLLFFPAVDGIHTIDGPETDEDVFLGLNVFYTYNAPRLRALVEYGLSNEENEIERLQVGWAFSDQLLAWAGRVHNPDNYWNTTFHHGQYLQTSISRPWISRFEDDGGPLLAHTTGVLIEQESHNDNGGAWSANVALGLGAHLEDDLEPFDFFSPSSGNGFAAHGRLAYLPDFLGQNQVGLVASYNDIEYIRTSQSALEIPSSIRQHTIGVYADWQWERTRVISEYRYIYSRLELPDVSNEQFSSFYAFLEQRLTERWTVYGRADLISGEQSSTYLALLQEFTADQWIAGVRWDLARRHALTLEFQDKRYNAPEPDRIEVLFQWSAALP